MSCDEYNKNALEMVLRNIDNVREAVDNWYAEKKMSEEAFIAVQNELNMAWSLINYMYLKHARERKEPTDV